MTSVLIDFIKESLFSMRKIVICNALFIPFLIVPSFAKKKPIQLKLTQKHIRTHDFAISIDKQGKASFALSQSSLASNEDEDFIKLARVPLDFQAQYKQNKELMLEQFKPAINPLQTFNMMGQQDNLSVFHWKGLEILLFADLKSINEDRNMIVNFKKNAYEHGFTLFRFKF